LRKLGAPARIDERFSKKFYSSAIGSLILELALFPRPPDGSGVEQRLNTTGPARIQLASIS
jgi:hypothetical protein